MLITLEDYISELRPNSHLLPKLQRMLERWQALPPHERPSNQHPIKRPPLPPPSRRNETPTSFAAQDPTPVGPTGGTTGEPIPEEATGIITEDQIPEDRRARWIVAMEELLQHLPQWLQQDNNYNRRDALSIMSDLPSSWPSCRLCINADAVATSYLAGMHRLFLEAKLTEKDHQTALQEANARAYEMEAICLDPLASHLHQLFVTDDDLFFDVYPEEWKQLQKLEFWQLSLMQEVLRIRRFIDKSTGKANFPQHTIEGVVHLRTRIHAPIDSLPTLLVIVTFPVTYLRLSCRGCRLCNQQLSHLRQNISKMSNECAWPVKLSPLLYRSQTAHVSKLRSVPVSFTPKELIVLSQCHQVQPGGSFAHSGRDFPVASLAERGSPAAAGQTSLAS